MRMCDRCRGRVGGAFDRADAAALPFTRSMAGSRRPSGDTLSARTISTGMPSGSTIHVPSSSASGCGLVDATPSDDSRLTMRVVVLGERAERDVLEPLAAVARIDRGPPVRVPERVEVEAAVDLAHVEAERAVELSRPRQVGHAEHETLQRMDGERVLAARQS